MCESYATKIILPHMNTEDLTKIGFVINGLVVIKLFWIFDIWPGWVFFHDKFCNKIGISGLNI